MEFNTRGNGRGLDDLYCMPEHANELHLLREFCKEKDRQLIPIQADVEGHPWYRRTFYEIPFGECHQEAIEKLLKEGGC